MSGFDHEAIDAALAAALRGDPMPSLIDTYDRNHSLACVDIAALDAWAKVSKYDPDGRQHSANWDIPREVDRKIHAAMKALDALREACAAARVRPDNV